MATDSLGRSSTLDAGRLRFAEMMTVQELDELDNKIKRVAGIAVSRVSSKYRGALHGDYTEDLAGEAALKIWAQFRSPRKILESPDEDLISCAQGAISVVFRRAIRRRKIAPMDSIEEMLTRSKDLRPAASSNPSPESFGVLYKGAAWDTARPISRSCLRARHCVNTMQ